MPSRAGFTLIEVIVAVSILAIALSGSAFLLAGAFGTYRHQNTSMEVFHVVHDKMEILTSTSYSQLSSEMQKARQPNDPPRTDVPADHDYIKVAAGDASARYTLVPESQESNVYKIVPKQDAMLHIIDGRHPTGELDAVIRLQYWDPTFDAPSMTDHGLIRASFSLKGEQLADQATKYFAR
jgi:prepilin-type N-terminal cleavage/methylation domain-containing protein